MSNSLTWQRMAEICRRVTTCCRPHFRSADEQDVYSKPAFHDYRVHTDIHLHLHLGPRNEEGQRCPTDLRAIGQVLTLPAVIASDQTIEAVRPGGFCRPRRRLSYVTYSVLLSTSRTSSLMNFFQQRTVRNNRVAFALCNIHVDSSGTVTIETASLTTLIAPSPPTTNYRPSFAMSA